MALLPRVLDTSHDGYESRSWFYVALAPWATAMDGHLSVLRTAGMVVSGLGAYVEHI